MAMAKSFAIAFLLTFLCVLFIILSMKYYSLSFYKDFSCIAEKCKHNCCLKWQIDIDKKTLKKYKKVKGDFSDALKNGIDKKNKCFKMCNNRCVFLNDNNLCDIIIHLGKDYLSQVCNDHPRYRNFLSDRIYLGVGLSCEENAKNVLSYLLPITEILISDDNKRCKKLTPFENIKLENRNNLLSLINASTSLNDTVNAVLSEISDLERFINFDFKKYLLNLEFLNDEFKQKLCSVNFLDTNLDPTYQKQFNNLLIYFIDRHVLNAFDIIDIKTKTIFSFFSVFIINTLFNMGNKNIGTLTDLAREYSEEIEYSENNLNSLFSLLEIFTKKD